jgi:glycine cleavage system pyridoxal-binding protein P
LKTDYAVSEIKKRTKHRVLFSASRFNEFVVELDAQRQHAGFPLSRFYPELGNSILLCVTETARREHIDAMVKNLEN